LNKISKIIQKNFSNVFVAVYAEKNEYVLRYIIVKNGKIVESEDKSYAVEADKKLPKYLKQLVASFERRYKFVYISCLLESISQNCIPTCDENEFEKYNIDKNKIVKVCVDNKWTVHCLKSDIELVKSFFEDVGVDFIYSPFIVLKNFIHEKKKKRKNNLFILYAENFVTLMVFDNDLVVFSAFFKVPHKEIELLEEEEDEELEPEESESVIEGIELDNIESEDEEFDSFVDITQLDEDDNDIQIQDDILDSAKEDVEASAAEDLELYGKEVVIFKFISSAIEEYYKNDMYKSEFLEEIIIYNNSNISNDIITMIENDLFLDIELHSVDMKEEMINMSIKEVDL